jgi:hypothetical protein
MAVSSSRYSTHRSSMVWRASAAMIGSTSSAWAMIIAGGLNRRPRLPSGPERDNRRNTARPTTTGGSPMKALSTTMTAARPGNRTSARKAPSGKPTRPASTVALRLTRSDRRTIA